jgi:hypothetical protein
MRIRTISFSFLLLFGSIINSQAQVSIGLVGFPQISSLTNKSDVIDNRLSFGGGGGLNVTYDFSEKIGVQLGVLYSSQNQKITSNYTLGGVAYSQDSKKRFTYLKLPVVLRMKKEIGAFDFVAFAGPQFSYLLKYDGGMVVYIEDQYFDLPNTPSGNKYYNNYTIDATGGVGLEFPLSKYVKLTTALKIDFNITNAQNGKATYSNFKVSDINGTGNIARNRTYALMLGINYKFKDPNDLLAPSNKFRKQSYGKKKRYK